MQPGRNDSPAASMRGMHPSTRHRFFKSAMTFIRRIATALLIGFSAAGLATSAAAATVKITFVLVNDIYQMEEQVLADGKARGGFARLAAVVKAERAKGGHVIFAHAGDTLSPSLMSSFDRGAHIIALTNMIRPDVFVPGNHEYDFGKEIFLQRMAEAKFPLYAANLRGADGNPIAGFKDRAIVIFNGVRIGIAGATADDAGVKSSPGDLKLAPTVETIKQQAAALRREGADFVVAVVHADRAQDRELFESRAADLILTGDDHDLYVNYDGRTAIVESSSDAHYVTAIDVTIETKETGGQRRTSWWPRFRVIDTAAVWPDPAVAAAVGRFKRRLANELDVVVGKTDIELDSRTATVRTREAAIGNLFADALRAATGADIAVTNGGGIRAGRIYPAGSSISRREILSELLFGNRVEVVSIGGKALKAALENGLSRLPQPAGRFPQVSGMTVEAELARPAGARIVSLTIGGAPLDESREYKLATNDYLARGGDGYTAFRDAKQAGRDYDGPLMAVAVMDYIRRIGTIRADTAARVILK